jgi:hypothetical protein
VLLLNFRRQGKTVVPLTIRLANGESPIANNRILVISGPNAGGKSVCLKTVAMLQYMLQCGLPVPMSEASKILKEELKFDVRTDFIPKFHITSTIRYKLEKEMATGGDKYDEIQWKASVSRKIGQFTLVLDGYNLLDTQEAKMLSRTSEYLSYMEKSQTGRFVMLSLTYHFK